jgi:hypothetical protein
MQVDNLWKGRLQLIIDSMGVTRPEDIEAVTQRVSQLEYCKLYIFIYSDRYC